MVLQGSTTGGVGSIPLRQLQGCYHHGVRLLVRGILTHRRLSSVAEALHVDVVDSGITQNIHRHMVTRTQATRTRHIHQAQAGDYLHTCQSGITMDAVQGVRDVAAMGMEVEAPNDTQLL